MKLNWKAILLASLIFTSTYGAGHAFADSPQTPIIAPAPTKDGEFLDIGSVSAERQKSIREAMQLGLINGYPNGKFKPDQTLNREELAVLLVKALKLPIQTPASPSFADVQSGDWGSPYIEAVKAAGLMSGSGSAFRPNDSVTREELAAIFVRAVHGENTTGGNADRVNDLNAASGWAESSVQAAIRLGLMNTDKDRFEPKQQVARQDIAQFLVDIFPEREQTATVTDVEGDVITVNGIPFLVTDELKKLLLSDNNVEALQGAVLRFKSAVRSVNDLSELEIVSTGTDKTPVKLDTTGMPTGSTLKVSGDHVAIGGGAVDKVILKGHASAISIDAPVNQLEVQSAKPVILSGTGTFKKLVVSEESSKLTIGSEVKIDKLVLPEGAKPGDFVQNLDQVKSQIGTVTTPSGNSVPLPAPTPVTQPVVTQSDLDRDAVLQDKQALTVGYVNGDTASSVTDNLTLGVFGSHGTTVTWSSSDTSVIATDGTVIRPVNGSGDATVTLTAAITKGGEQDEKTFTLTVKEAEAPESAKIVSAAMDQDNRVITIAFDRPIQLGPDYVDPDIAVPSLLVEYNGGSSQIENYDGTATIDPSDHTKLMISFPVSLKNRIGDVHFKIYLSMGYVDDHENEVSGWTPLISFNAD